MREKGYEGLLYSHLFLAWADATQGRVDECRLGLVEARELAERSGHPYLLAMTLAFGAAVWRDLGEAGAAEEWAARSMPLCQEHGFVFWLAGCLSVTGWFARQRGDAQAGLASITQGVSIYRQMGARINCPYYLTYLVECELGEGRVDGRAGDRRGGRRVHSVRTDGGATSPSCCGCRVSC